MNKEDSALNNLQWLICHKTKPKQISKSLKASPNGIVVGCLGFMEINLWRLFNAKSIFMEIVLFQIIQSSMSI